MELELLGYIKDGKYRLKTLKLLNNSPSLPSELADKLNVSRSSMSRILRNLKGKMLITSSKSSSRTLIYSITDKGKKLLSEIDEKEINS